MKRRVVAGILAAGALAFAAAGAQGVPTGAKVSATDFEFTEEEVKISKGEKVIWTFDEGKHNVTGKGFNAVPRPARVGKTVAFDAFDPVNFDSDLGGDAVGARVAGVSLTSSRIAVCGQQPVCTAAIRSAASTPAARRKRASSVV